MKENNLEELIDGFLRNKLNIADQARLRDIITSDPEAAALLKESQETYRYILHLHYNNIRRQLQSYDHQQSLPRNPSRIKRLFIAASFLMLLLLGSYLFICYSFSPRLVAIRNFEAISAVGLAPETLAYVTSAEEFFIQNNFQGAASLYKQSAEMMNDRYAQPAKWNYLMCRLAIEGPSEEWKQEMFTFISVADDNFKMEAYRILRLYNSVLYRLYIGIATPEFSPIKPRLI